MAQLTIKVETGETIEAQFNPNKLVFSKTSNWTKHAASQREVPELQFGNSEPRTLTVDLIFDTYDAPGMDKKDVRTYTDRLLALTAVSSELHRPPVCLLSWPGPFLECVVTQIDQTFTLFTDTGIPVRASVKCTFKEWRTNREDLLVQNKHSSDVAKARMVRHGDTLASIAATEYRDPRKWRAIALASGIDDPLNMEPGVLVRVPALSD